jgi:hypothetical protein
MSLSINENISVGYIINHTRHLSHTQFLYQQIIRRNVT